MAAPLAEADLTIGRAKPRSLATALAYRAMGVARKLVGRPRLLRWSLETAWLARRFAFELSGEVFGAPFHAATIGLRPELLLRYLPAGGTFLDVGCGHGRWSCFAARHAASVVGMDLDQRSLAIARAAAAEQGLDNVEFLHGDVTRDLAGRRFDLALLSHVIEHIDDAEDFLRKLAAVTSVLVIEVPDFDSDPLNRARHQLGCRFYSDGDHVREYTADILAAQVRRAGWEVRHQESPGGSLVLVAGRGPRAL